MEQLSKAMFNSPMRLFVEIMHAILSIFIINEKTLFAPFFSLPHDRHEHACVLLVRLCCQLQCEHGLPFPNYAQSWENNNNLVQGSCLNDGSYRF